MVNWENIYRRYVWYSQYSGILEKGMIIFLISFWIKWIIIGKLSIIGLVVTCAYIYGLIFIWEICYKLLEKLTIPYKLKVYMSSQGKKLARFSTEDPKIYPMLKDAQRIFTINKYLKVALIDEYQL